MGQHTPLKRRILLVVKELLTRIGARTPPALLHQLQMGLNYLKLGRWMRKHAFALPRTFSTREEVFAVVASKVEHRQVLYLEFGVFAGVSMRYWSSALKNPDSKLHGFDSFEGLPEDFDVEGPYERGTFNVDGRIPQIPDGRVSFFKGWFNETLPSYSPPAHDVLVMNLDADLYSSTVSVLERFESLIQPGTFIYFDDMSRPEHEPKAFEEFMNRTGRRFRLVSADRSLNNAFFECVAAGAPT